MINHDGRGGGGGGGGAEGACIADLMFSHGPHCHCFLFHEHGKQILCVAISPVKKASTLHMHISQITSFQPPLARCWPS